MNTEQLTSSLDQCLPDSKIVSDLSNLIWDVEIRGEIELDSGFITVPNGVELAVVTKAFFKEYYEIGFGVYRVQIAVGGVTTQAHGILEALYCFATLYYNTERELLSTDFHSEMR